MISKNALLKESNLYVILDRDSLCGRNNMLSVARQASRAGADILQLRDKQSNVSEMIRAVRALKKISGRYGVWLTVNDRLEVAVAGGADGLHIGQGDVDISLARRLMGKDALIGLSAGSVKEASKAKRKGASYVGIGPVFKTPLKSEDSPTGFGVLEKAKKLGIPVFAIGGINSKNVNELKARGFRNIAVIRAVCSSEDPFRAVQRLKKAL